MNLDIVFSGVGGQGVVVLSDIYCEAAMLDGFDVAKAEIHGMAQRGGSIVAYTRIGGKVESPLIETGKADVIVGFEILETARALPMLKKNGYSNREHEVHSAQLHGFRRKAQKD